LNNHLINIKDTRTNVREKNVKKLFLLTIFVTLLHLRIVPEIEINTTEIENFQQSIKCNGEVLTTENFLPEENKNISLPRANV
jgi:hypothetical protein